MQPTINMNENGTCASVTIETAIGTVEIRPYTVRCLRFSVKEPFKLFGIEYTTSGDVTPGPGNTWYPAAVSTRRSTSGWGKNEPTDKARRAVRDVLDAAVKQLGPSELAALEARRKYLEQERVELMRGQITDALAKLGPADCINRDAVNIIRLATGSLEDVYGQQAAERGRIEELARWAARNG